MLHVSRWSQTADRGMTPPARPSETFQDTRCTSTWCVVPQQHHQQRHLVRRGRTAQLQQSSRVPQHAAVLGPHDPSAETKALKEDHREGSACLLCPDRIHLHAIMARPVECKPVRCFRYCHTCTLPCPAPDSCPLCTSAPTLQSGRLCNKVVSKQPLQHSQPSQHPQRASVPASSLSPHLSHQPSPSIDRCSAVCSTLATTRFGVTWRPIPRMQSALYKNSHLPIAVRPPCGTHSEL